jgi:hypothetical protein
MIRAEADSATMTQGLGRAGWAKADSVAVTLGRGRQRRHDTGPRPEMST